MADSSILTLGRAQSQLVDSSVYDSTTKDNVFLGMACENGEGKSACSSLHFLTYVYVSQTNVSFKQLLTILVHLNLLRKGPSSVLT